MNENCGKGMWKLTLSMLEDKFKSIKNFYVVKIKKSQAENENNIDYSDLHIILNRSY
ncbi:MAG: hypothetical protein PHI32_14460 [Dysgonamonadaceae bacterium]|nr:hypothetical protein [Dysgonamonadaceae bacterium]